MNIILLQYFLEKLDIFAIKSAHALIYTFRRNWKFVTKFQVVKK